MARRQLTLDNEVAAELAGSQDWLHVFSTQEVAEIDAALRPVLPLTATVNAADHLQLNGVAGKQWQAPATAGKRR